MSNPGAPTPGEDADGSRGSVALQGARVPELVGLAAFVLWLLLAMSSGGVDFGRPVSGDAAAWRAAAAALSLGAVLAAVMVWNARSGPVWRSGPFLLGAVGAGGLTLWAALSIGWAPAPDLAWIEANRYATGALALVIGAGIANRRAAAARWFALALSAGGMVIAIRALVVESLPEQLGSDLDFGRLSEPLGAPNSLAAVMALALPGLIWWAGRRGPAWVPAMAAAATVPVLVALALTLSRSGYLAALTAITIGVVASSSRIRAVTVIGIGGLCAAAPIWHGLTSDPLTADRVAVTLRADPGLTLGLLVLGATVVAAALAALVLGRRSGTAGTALAVLALAVLAPIALAAGEDNAPQRDSIANEPTRVVSLSSNNRTTWWGEAVDGWRDHPVIGNGAGSFSLVHLRERDDGEDRFNVREPHQILLKALSDLGLVGLFLLLATGAAALWAALRQRARGDGDWLLAVAPLAALVVAAQFDVSLSVPALSVPAFAAVGVLVGAAARDGSSPVGRSNPGLAVGVGTLVTLGLIASALVPLAATEFVRSADHALRDGNPERARELAAQARDLNPLSTAPLDTAASAHRDEGDIGSMIAALTAATDLQPDNARTWRRLAQVLEALGDPRAAAAWQRVVQLDPHNRGAAAAGVQADSAA